jgi:hypothetical protein
MPVRGHDQQRILTHREQEAIEVVADVLLCHRVLDQREQLFQLPLRQRCAGSGARGRREFWKVHCWQRLQRELTLAGTQLQTLVGKFQADLGAVG